MPGNTHLLGKCMKIRPVNHSEWHVIFMYLIKSAVINIRCVVAKINLRLVNVDVKQQVNK